MYRIAVCDDESIFLDSISEMISYIMSSNKISYTIDKYNSGKQLIDDLQIQPNRYDLLLIDIILQNENGVDIAKQLRELKNNITIIFVTSSEDYLLEGYEAEPLGYIVKPPDINKLEQTVMKAYRRLMHDSLLICTTDGISKFSFDEIMYIEVLNKKLIMYLSSNRSIEFQMPLNQMLPKLPPDRFIQCHRSYIVSISAIFSIKRYEIILNNYQKIPVSKRKYKGIQEALLHYAVRL